MPRLIFRRVYHVPGSQVWAGSRGGQRGRVHLHTVGEFHLGRIHRYEQEALCAKTGWYERPADASEEVCQRCAEILERYRRR